MINIHLIVPMSGQGTRYQKAGFSQPKPLISINGVPMIERLLQEFPAHWPTTFVMAENHIETPLPSLLKKLRPQSTLLSIPPHSEGPGKALEAALEKVSPHSPVLVSYCDYGMQWDVSAFEKYVFETNCDACVVCYRGFHAHYLNPQTYAYCRMQGEQVVEVREKGSFTNDRENEYASSGAYYFKSAALLKEALSHQKKLKLVLNGESYTSLSVEALLQLNPRADVRVFEIPFFYQWGTPDDLKNFSYWEQNYAAYLKFSSQPSEVSQVLMPMAGLGSRFSSLTSLPKALIPINGEPMYKQALASLPQATHQSVFVSLNEVASKLKLEERQKVVGLEKTPEGQALSTLAGVKELNSMGDVVVSSCDHGIALDPERFKKFRSNPQCDAAIFTIQGYPGCNRKPQAFAYVKDALSPAGEENDFATLFPLVEKVAVKEALSNAPSNDHLLVGTFWFASRQVLEAGIQELQAKNLRVNGELYLDSVFELLLQKGLKVRRIPLDAYLCWGDPDSLAEALYYFEAFCGRRLTRRSRFPGVNER